MIYALAIKPVLITLAIIMNTPAMLENIKNSFKSNIYNAGTTVIDLTQGAIARTATLLIRAKQHKASDRNIYQKMASQKIKHIENSLLEEEKKIIEDIYDDYNITQDQRKIAARLISCLKEDNKDLMSRETQKYMLENDEKQKLDNNLHQDLVSLFKKVDLNPNIKIIISTTDNKIIASMRGCLRDYNIMSDGTIVPQNDIVKSSKLTLYKSFFSLSENDKLASLYHEMGHLKAGHTATKTPILWKISSSTGIPQKELMENSNWEKLVAIHEQQAEILNKDATSIELVRTARKKGFHPEGLFVRHYAQLSLVHSCHRFGQDLENYKTIPIQKFPDIKNMKFNGPVLRL
jgi:hypothetical protein